LKEFKSAALYEEVLEKEGFRVEKGICGIETAFSASFGSGRPVIGILAEYDALSGLSQVAGGTERKEIVSGGCGHGCGHNLLGAGAFAGGAWREGISGEDRDAGNGDSVWLSGRSKAALRKHSWRATAYGRIWTRRLRGTRRM